VYSYDPETKQQSSQWKLPNSPWPKKARQVRSNVKSMLIFFFSTLKALSTRNSYPWSNHQWQVLLWGFDAAEGTHHLLFVVRQFLTSKNITVTPPLAWPRPLRLFPIPQDEIMVERASFWHDWGDPCRNARGYRHTHIRELSGMQEIMGNMLGSLYTKGTTLKETVETRNYDKKLIVMVTFP